MPLRMHHSTPFQMKNSKIVLGRGHRPGENLCPSLENCWILEGHPASPHTLPPRRLRCLDLDTLGDFGSLFLCGPHTCGHLPTPRIHTAYKWTIGELPKLFVKIRPDSWLVCGPFPCYRRWQRNGPQTIQLSGRIFTHNLGNSPIGVLHLLLAALLKYLSLSYVTTITVCMCL